MDINKELRQFLGLYQTVGWVMVLIGGGLLLQGLIWLIAGPVLGSETLYSDIIHRLILPARIRDLIYSPWTIVTYPFFWESLGSDFLRMIFGIAFIWLFGQIYQQLLGAASLRRLLILAVPAIGILTVLINAPFSLVGKDVMYIDGVTYLMVFLAVACATLTPDYPIQLFLLGQVKIKWMVLILVILNLAYTLVTPLGVATLVAAGLGFLHIYYMREGTDVTDLIWSYYQDSNNPSAKKATTVSRMRVNYGGKYGTQKQEKNRESGSAKDGKISQDIVDKLLDKINEHGYDSLSREEKELLFKASSQREDD